jgi:hypothetical protein
MGILEPQEIRYTIISVFALVIMNSMTVFMGLSASSWNPNEPDVPQSGGYNPGDPEYWSSWKPGSLTNIREQSFWGDFIGLITDGIGYVVATIEGWQIIINNAGWAAAFITVPSIVMLLIIANTGYKVVKAIPYT